MTGRDLLKALQNINDDDLDVIVYMEVQHNNSMIEVKSLLPAANVTVDNGKLVQKGLGCILLSPRPTSPR